MGSAFEGLGCHGRIILLLQQYPLYACPQRWFLRAEHVELVGNAEFYSVFLETVK
jgi:hypothetical protein